MKFIWNEPELSATADLPASHCWKDVVIAWLRYNNVCFLSEQVDVYYDYSDHCYVIDFYGRKGVESMRAYLRDSSTKLFWAEDRVIFRHLGGEHEGAPKEYGERLAIKEYGGRFVIKAEDFTPENFKSDDTSSSTFYTVVTSDSMTDGSGESIAWETPIANNLTREQAAARQSEVTEQYGTSWIAKCEIIEDSRIDPKPVSRRELIDALNDAEKNTESSAAQWRSLRLLRRYMKQCEGENAD